MEDMLQQLSELCREPILAVTDGKLRTLNAAARQLFPDCAGDADAARFLPAHLLQEPAVSFRATAVLNDRHYTVSAQHSGDTLLLALAPQLDGVPRGFLSDSLMSGMLSALFNIELSTQRLRGALESQTPETEKYLSTLFHSYHLLYHRLSNLDLMQQLSENNLTMVPRRTDLVTLCHGLADSVNYLLPAELPKIECLTTLETLPAIVDAPKVERMLINLLSNALKHTLAGGSIRLRLSRSGDNAVISVDDSGCGIAPEVLNHVFTAYELRLNIQDMTSPGTGGLGLSISRAIAERHNGVLILESREGEGTSIRVLLPLSPSNADAFHCEPPVYEASGMSFLLTELSDVLDWTAYTEKHLD